MPLTTDEELRQRAIAEYRLTNAALEPVFNNVTALAAAIFDVPTALVTVLREDRQLFSGACGIEGKGTERKVAFCNYTVEQPEQLVVEDAHADPRFSGNALVVGEPSIRFYAGVPLRVGGGVAVGSLCLIDYKPRTISAEQLSQLRLLGRTVSDLMELRVGAFVSEQRKAQLERQTELLRATIDNVDQGVGLFDCDLRLALWNNHFFELLDLPSELAQSGTEAAELLAVPARRGDFGAGDPDAIVVELVQSIRTTPRRILQLHMVGGRTLEANRCSLPDGRSIISVEDVTERTALARMKDQFISTVSHELRTPLTSIVGSLALLDRTLAGPLDARSTQLLTMAKQNAARLSSLIDDILHVEKLGSGDIEFVQLPVDLVDVARKAVEQNRPYAANLSVDLELDAADAPLMVTGDCDRLLQALTNLVSNAAKFSPTEGVVTISAKARDGQARVTVTDRGPGIPAEFRPRIFDRFTQAGPAQQRGRSGTGLGLAITKSIVARHGGTIDFETEIGKGTQFWIDLPLQEDGQ